VRNGKYHFIQGVCDALAVSRKQELGEKLLSPEEARKVFTPQISLPTLNRWTKAGHLKIYKIGGRTWYKYNELIEAAKELKPYKTALKSA
jgi:hypothetical protein